MSDKATMRINDIKKVLFKNSFFLFTLATFWPLLFLIFNELLFGQYKDITLGVIVAYIGPMIFLPFIGYLIQDKYERGEDLSKATENISELMLKVVKDRQLGIRYKNQRMIPCWNVRKCDKKE